MSSYQEKIQKMVEEHPEKSRQEILMLLKRTYALDENRFLKYVMSFQHAVEFFSKI